MAGFPVNAAATLSATYRAVTDLVAGRTDRDFDRPTRCEGLAVGPLLFHLLLNAQRALMAFASPGDPHADRDFASYWEDFPGRIGPRPDPDPSVAFVIKARPRTRARPRAPCAPPRAGHHIYDHQFRRTM